jgi:hypothetical protein
MAAATTSDQHEALSRVPLLSAIVNPLQVSKLK